MLDLEMDFPLIWLGILICYKNKLKKNLTGYPNVNVALRIYQAIFGSFSEGERSSSVLKRIKSCQRSTISQGGKLIGTDSTVIC